MFITVHCSATKPKYRTSADDIDKWHRVRGFRKIGYHWYIDRDGNVVPGRGENETGAHVQGHNANNIGICLEGGLNDDTGEPENNYTVEQWDALTLLIKEVVGRHGVKWTDIKGHRDWSPDSNGDGVIDSRDWLKACPCFDVSEYINGERFS